MSNVAANSAAGSVKVCMFLKRKNGTSHDEFNQYWSEKHAPLIQEWLPKHGISRDTQYHTSPTFQQQHTSKIPGLQSLKPLDFDGLIELVMPNAQCLSNAQNDPFYRDTIRPSEEKFTEVSQTQYMVGWQETIIHKGRAVGNAKSHYYDTADHGGDEGLGVEHHAARDDV